MPQAMRFSMDTSQASFCSPAALAMLILLADATGENPKDFGGINLMSRLAKTRQ